jgi:DNA polymerase III subunit epsilon
VFAIIDIETCGGKFDFRNGRITEICIVKHDGLQVVDVWASLINPECNISTYFTSLTGITNDMVRDAPKFYEVAKKILEMTEGCIFVAHNSPFDYGFIKEEFASLGYKFRKDTLCTVRLSRKLMPGRISYSLGHLCASLGIEIEGRHRAQGDAEATAKLFDLLLTLKSQHPQYKNMGLENIMTRRIDKIKEYILKKLPEECGVYYFLNKNKEIIYIGKSNNMYSRAIQHFNSKEGKSKKLLNDLMNVDFVVTGSELVALLLEAEEIKKHKPKYNRARKGDSFSHCIDWFTDKKGIVNFRIAEYEEAENCIAAFTSYHSSREKLEHWIDEHQLCLRYCGLTGEEAICFNHQIKKCNGICNEEEEIDIYNERARELITKFSYKENNFIILDKGRTNEERSLILIEDGKYKGFGYIDQSHQISSPDECRDVIKQVNYYPDADALVKSWMKTNRYHKTFSLPEQQNDLTQFG